MWYWYKNRQIWSCIFLRGFWLLFKSLVIMGFPDDSNHKKSAYNVGDSGSIPGLEDSWRTEWLSSPVFLSGEIPWTEEPCELQCMRSQRVRHDWVAITFTFNTSQLFYFLISKIVCMFLRICQYLLYFVIYSHYQS